MIKTPFIFAPLLLQVFVSCSQSEIQSSRRNSPGELKTDANHVAFIYNNEKILDLEVGADPSSFTTSDLIEEEDGKINHVFTITSKSYKALIIKGVIKAGNESFACEADRRIKGTQVVRHVYGPSSNWLNRAVYDRGSDWLLSADQSSTSATFRITPLPKDSTASLYSLTMSGSQLTIRFRPHYYQKHRGLKYFDPSAYKIWSKPVAGWCSWYAFMTDISEQNVKATCDVIAEAMMPYGLEYFQIDDGYQQNGGQPEKWINPNEKFPSGLPSLASYIKSKGLKPGIWTNVAIHDSAYASEHKKWFLTESSGELSKGRWVDYIMDGTNQETLDSMISPIYKNYKETGWEYFKLDALRHLLFEGYNSHSAFFRDKKSDREAAFRSVVARVREDISADNFLLSCWGVLPAVVGLADGCRIGTDGYGYTALTQYNSYNNVVWRNDPDHIELTPKDAYRSSMVTSLTGSVFMITDKPEVYHTKIIEAAQKSLPVLFTMPGQVFDLDPSHSMMIDRTLSEMSGSGEREADGSQTSPYDLFMLEINKPWESWVMLGRTGTAEQKISFEDIGLDPNAGYIVYEFWTDDFLGTCKTSFSFGVIDPEFNCQLFCIRKMTDHPQILATSRHISCGATDLSEISWENNILKGTSTPVAGNPYTLTIYEPKDSGKGVFSCSGAEVKSDTKSSCLRKVTILAKSSGPFKWSLKYF